MRPHLILVLVLVVATATAAWTPTATAQSTSVEELERRLQKAKEEKARRDAASARAREDTEAERRKREAEVARAESERKAQEARMATVVVQTDAPCTLSINGKEAAKLSAGITEVRVAPGQMLIGCASTEERVSYDGELEARSGQNALLRISLATKVAESRSTRAAALEREAQARRAVEAKARLEAETKAACDRGERSTMHPTVSSGVVRQACPGLEWTAQDNGRDVGWQEAQAYCRGLGGGWSLPTVEQLQWLYDANLPSFSCGGNTCRVSNQLRLSSFWFWSAEPNGSSRAWAVHFGNGERYPGSVDSPSGAYSSRALCVRRP